MSKAIHILLIDDEQNESAFIKAFQNKARDFGMKITHFQRGKLGLDELKLNPYKYKALILDARCIWDETQQFPDDKFLTRAVAELERLEKELNQTYPTVVNTGYIDAFQQEREFILSRHGEIFEKSTDDESKSIRIFEFLKDKIENSQEWKYADVFEIFDKDYLDATFRAHLLKLLKTSNSDDSTEIKKNLALLRSLQEQIFQTLNKKDNQIVPDRSAKPKVRFWEVQKQLSGNLVNNSSDRFIKDFQPTTEVFQNDSIKNLSECIYKIASDDGSHNPYENTPLPNKYTVQSLTFAFLEQLLWFKNLMS